MKILKIIVTVYALTVLTYIAFVLKDISADAKGVHEVRAFITNKYDAPIAVRKWGDW